MDQPIRIDNPIQSGTRSELIIRPVPSHFHLILFFKSTRLMTTDLKAAQHVLFNSYNYLKPKVIRGILIDLFGSGAFCRILVN